MPWLPDTNILSEIRLKPEPKVLAFIDGCPLDELYISAVTLANFASASSVWTQATAGRNLGARSRIPYGTYSARGSCQLQRTSCLKWRVLMEQGRKVWHTYSQPDLIIAATALLHGLTVVTRDQSDSEKAGVSFINPWVGPKL